jgi:hypothetical protein
MERKYARKCFGSSDLPQVHKNLKVRQKEISKKEEEEAIQNPMAMLVWKQING